VTDLVAPLDEATGTVVTDRAVRRRVGWIWALLFFNVLAYEKLPMLVPIPSILGKALTQGSLWAAFLLALTVNRRGLFRSNAFLVLGTLLAATSLIMSVRTLHVGSIYRAVRLIGFLATLWLLTPWWGRRDLMLTRFHVRCMVGVMISAMAGYLVAHHKAMASGRLFGVIWPIPAPQLAHYSAVAVGLGIVLWFSGLLRRRQALALVGFGLVVLLLTHTRTALVAMSIAVLVAALSLFVSNRRVRRALAGFALIVVLVAIPFAPAISHWFVRGENTTTFSDLTGRTLVWHELINLPRTNTQVLLGSGLSNKSFQGLPIDDSWLAIYQDQGLVGDAIVALFMLALLLKAFIVPRGPAKSLALFLIVYCLVASYTEVGLGDASTYILDLSIAGSLLMSPAWTRITETVSTL
jgi:O-antigen ligase